MYKSRPMLPLRLVTVEEQLALHLADGRAPVFEGTGQDGRVKLGRKMTEAALRGRTGRIIELGCGSGDISGFFAKSCNVLGVDIVLAAKDACAKRWPDMEFQLRSIESTSPRECDVLILTEILEHLAEPLKIVEAWLPLAKTAVIGHPLCPPDKDVEQGHCWSYDYDDWTNWFKLGGHTRIFGCVFPMSVYDDMIIGWSMRESPRETT